MSIFTSLFTSRREKAGRPARPYPLLLRQFQNYTDYLRPQRWNWGLLTRSLDERTATDTPDGSLALKIRGLRYFLFDGLFATICDNFFANYVVLFALAYHAGNGQLGLLTAVGNLMGTLALFPGARAVEKTGRKKPIVVWSGGVGSRVAVLLLAFIPFFFTDGPAAIVLIIVLHGARAFLGNFSNPAWTALVADLVPSELRGRYFSSRNIVMGIAALLVAPVAGYIIRHGNGFRSIPLLGYQLVFSLAFLFGMMSAVSFSRIPEPASSVAVPKKREKGDLRRALKANPRFTGFLAGAFIWNLAIQISAPFFSVFMVRSLGASVLQVGIGAGASSLATLIGQLYFGRRIEKHGNVKIQSITGLFVPLIPCAWALATTIHHVYLINFLGALAWAGYHLTNFNLLLELTPDEQRPRAVALYQTVVFTSAVLGPLIGGYLADAVSYRFVFWMSGAGRAMGIGLFLLLVARKFHARAGTAGPGRADSTQASSSMNR